VLEITLDFAIELIVVGTNLLKSLNMNRAAQLEPNIISESFEFARM